MKDELNSIIKNNTWTLVEKPPDVQIIGSKWVFAIKYSDEGPKFKTRLVAKGYSEIEGIHYQETFSPVIRYNSFRLLLAHAVELNMEIRHLDVKTAFLNADLKENIYLSPQGIDTSGKVCKLNKAIYGLKQSSICWFQKISDVLKNKLNFLESLLEPCIFYKETKKGLVIIALWVDDIFLMSNDSEETINTRNYILKTFEMKDMGIAKNVLGLNLHHYNDGSLLLNAENYINQLLKKYSMEDSNPVKTPMEPKLKISDDKPFTGPYRELIGSLMYIAITCRPDILFAVTFLSQFNNKPTEEAWKATKRILRYTREIGLFYYPTANPLFGFSDADWVNDEKDRKSFGGYVFVLGGAAVSWP